MGQGSTFRVYLPVYSAGADDQNRITRDSVPPGKIHGNDERILLVEDEESIRAVTQRLLAEHGYTVYPAKSVEEALDMFTREDGNFHLVLSDVVLPDGSGAELVTRLLTLSPRLHVILSSGYVGEKSQFSLIQEKGYTFIQKPYTAEKLLQSVKKELTVPKQESATQGDSI